MGKDRLESFAGMSAVAFIAHYSVDRERSKISCKIWHCGQKVFISVNLNPALPIKDARAANKTKYKNTQNHIVNKMSTVDRMLQILKKKKIVITQPDGCTNIC